MTDEEFEAILADETKRIEGDIHWSLARGPRSATSFTVAVTSRSAWDLRLRGRMNPGARKLSYTLYDPEVGRLLGLDYADGHSNPDGHRIEGVHLHRWSEEHRDDRAYVPDGITAPWYDTEEVWLQFCTLAKIRHDGIFHPPARQAILPL